MNRHVLALAEELRRRPRDLHEVSRLASKASVRRFLADHSVESENSDCAVALTCIRRGDFHALNVLLREGANANIVVRDNYTSSTRSLLHEAVRCENPRIVQLLLKHGADVSLKDSAGLTPDLEAVRVENVAVLRVILDSRVRPDLNRLLSVATRVLFVDRERMVSPDRAVAVLRLLLDRGANPDEVQSSFSHVELEARIGEGSDQSALQMARSGFAGLNGQQEALQLLEQYSVRPSAPHSETDPANSTYCEPSTPQRKADSTDCEPTCPVCLEMPTRVLCCQQCDNMVCSECVGHLHACPLCRLDFNVKPPVRNRLAERILEQFKSATKL